MYSFVKGFFEGNSDLNIANKTLISLIPKRDQPQRVAHFRTISLCSVQYKRITKILPQRLRCIMDELILPYQASFIPGRHLQDNVIVGQEILQKVKKSKGRRGFMVMKIDLKKAFDCLKWSFLREVISRAGFGNKFIELAMRCVSIASLNVLWNGNTTEFFHPSRGIR